MLAGLDLARRGLLDDPTIAALLAAADSSRLPHPAIFLEIERIIGLESLDAYFDQHAREQAAATADATVSTTDRTRDEAVLAYNQSIDRAIEILKQELGEVPSPNSAPGLGSDVRHARDPRGSHRSPRRACIARAAAQLTHRVGTGHRCIRAASITGLRLEPHRLANGGYPQTLSQLTPPPPEDPLAPGRLLGYQPPEEGRCSRGLPALFCGDRSHRQRGQAACRPPSPRCPVRSGGAGETRTIRS